MESSDFNNPKLTTNKSDKFLYNKEIKVLFVIEFSAQAKKIFIMKQKKNGPNTKIHFTNKMYGAYIAKIKSEVQIILFQHFRFSQESYLINLNLS